MYTGGDSSIKERVEAPHMTFKETAEGELETVNGRVDRTVTDGGEDPVYDVDPSGQIWWEKLAEPEEDVEPSQKYGEFFDTLEVPGERFVEGSSEAISQEYAFNRDEMMEIESAVDEVYDQTNEFLDDVIGSNMNPQQAKQIERWFHGETYRPNTFDSYDGFPVME
ncbi:MAG: hypothetical protein H8Z69_02215 [Nanohaloarchaea archaeon]|nr:hypothetical protein [Candidatus Nanohaloarchaea archaeon]